MTHKQEKILPKGFVQNLVLECKVRYVPTLDNFI